MLVRVRFLVCVLALASLALVGCRESLVTPEPPGSSGPAPIGPASVEEGFLKGPARLEIGEVGEFKGQLDAAVVHYQWHQSGEGALLMPGTSARLAAFEAVSLGEVLVEYVGYDSSSQPVLRGTLRLQIVP